MLIYVRLSGGLSETLFVFIEPNEPLSAVRAAVLRLRPHVAADSFKFLPFAGRALSDERATLLEYKIQKECSLDCRCQVGEVGAPAALPVLPLAPIGSYSALNFSSALPGVSSSTGSGSARPHLLREASERVVQFGDAVFVTLISARNLPVLPY